jgi:hypothetical protein
LIELNNPEPAGRPAPFEVRPAVDSEIGPVADPAKSLRNIPLRAKRDRIDFIKGRCKLRVEPAIGCESGNLEAILPLVAGRAQMRFVRDVPGKVRLHVALHANAYRGMTLVACKMGVYGRDRRDRGLDTSTSIKANRSVKATIV